MRNWWCEVRSSLDATGSPNWWNTLSQVFQMQKQKSPWGEMKGIQFVVYSVSYWNLDLAYQNIGSVWNLEINQKEHSPGKSCKLTELWGCSMGGIPHQCDWRKLWSCASHSLRQHTPRKINMESKNHPIEKKIHLANLHVWLPCDFPGRNLWTH